MCIPALSRRLYLYLWSKSAISAMLKDPARHRNQEGYILAVGGTQGRTPESDEERQKNNDKTPRGLYPRKTIDMA